MPITKATASSIAPAAKGDLVVGSATNDAAVLGVGSNDQVLTADSSTATGLKWATPASGVPANAAATVATTQGTSSSTYTDLATAGPSVTLTTGTKALVLITTELDGGGNYGAYAGYAVSGATTIAASDADASAFSSNGLPRFAFHSVPTLNAGSNTFTVKYRVESGGGSKNFRLRQIFVINLA